MRNAERLLSTPLVTKRKLPVASALTLRGLNPAGLGVPARVSVPPTEIANPETFYPPELATYRKRPLLVIHSATG
jgi:hypothetical protein